ncbi:hypothetical protein [uncultured Meiothermus sp.]|jgi:hypothetical protein|uniref:hypothetical protein n=1 Tax=uncultured Meiothermus sp. TaxID=157471 RepID=UPI00262FDE62|nr:hypothetical protein [uncultured Meiothermus sp.]
MISVLEHGVGAIAEEKIKTIAPLVEYYETEMGLGAGRLMLATNFLRDAREMQPNLTPEARAALEQAEALVVSTMIRFLGAGKEGEGCGCGEGCNCADSIQQQAQAWLDKAKNRS